MYPNVLTEIATIGLLRQGKSIARYGDGELKICRGAGIKCQDYDPILSQRLQKILKHGSPNCLVGIPRINTTDLNPDKEAFWGQYRDKRYLKFYNPDHWYASAFITRPDSIPALYNMSYFERVKDLWTNRPVLLINGDNRPFDKDPEILHNAKRVEIWRCPSQNAWGQYTQLLSNCAAQPKGTLFILAAGPTATVLAYDLAGLGHQALDLGHFGMYYNRLAHGEPLR